MNNTLLIILSLVLLIGCENNGQALKEPPQEVPKEIPEHGFPKSITPMQAVENNSFLNYCEGVEKLHQVINDEDSWQRLLSKIDPNCVPFTELVADFSRFTVIAAFADPEDEVCPSVGIIGICEYENSVRVWLGKGAIPQPYDIVKIPKTGKPVDFVEYDLGFKCGY